MKKKVGIIASAVASCAVCASMIAGSTYALFTSEDSVDVSVTAGNVSITATLGEELTSASTLGDNKALGEISNEEGKIVLTNIAPGDTYSFTIQVENSSSVSIQYRTKIELSNGDLAEALEVTIGDTTYDADKCVTAWTKVEEAKGAIEDITVTISFPNSSEDQNDLQDKTTDITVTVEGVQANGVVEGTYDDVA